MVRARRRQRAATRVVRGLGFLALAGGLAGCRADARVGAASGAAAPGREAAARGDERALRPLALTYLQDDYERIFPERVRLAHYGKVRYAARELGDAAGDGERSDAIDMGEAPSLVVVDQVRSRVRVIAPQDHYRLLLWVDDEDLYTVVTALAALAPDGAGRAAAPASADHAAIRLHPGMAVAVDGETGGMAHVRHRDDCVSFSGLMPRAALGTQFEPIETTERHPDGAVAAGTAVYDRPGGRQVARFLADCEVEWAGPESDGHRPIRYASEWFELRGWIATAGGKTGAASSSSGSWSYGLGHLGLWGSRSRMRLPEGTCLFARRGGPAVGVITEDTDAPLSPPVHGWWPVPLETGWGDLTVWVAQDRSGAAERARRERKERREQAARARSAEGEEGAAAGGEEGDADGEGEPGDDEQGDAQQAELRRCQ
ncbi:MAG TPA: hypothetical protein VKB80_36180 [Kofleriaceae bacterium]|nr:hypothetical protein [Kofleriaceae bacterium]